MKKDLQAEALKLKEKYGTIHLLEVPETEDNPAKVLILRKIDRVTYSAFQKILEKDTLQAAEMVLKSLRVGGDEIKPIVDDLDQLRAAADCLIDILAAPKGNVVKL